MSVFGMIASAIAGPLFGSIGNMASNAASNAQNFQYNSALQQASFQHDKDMLAAQVDTSMQLAKKQLQLKHDMLRVAGYTHADAARGALGAPVTRILDWNGTRNYAPQAAATSSFSGGFSPQFQVSKPVRGAQRVQRAPSLASSTSWGQPQASLSTVSTAVSRSSSGSRSSRSSLSRSWYTGSSRSLEPFAPGALQTAFVTPPGSVSSRASTRTSASTASTVDERLLSSWKPFNLRNQPGFTRFHPRGSSNA